MLHILAQAALSPAEADFFDAKTLVAAGGLLLGIINFVYLLYKEVLKKPRLEVAVESATARARNEGTIDIQLSLRLAAKRRGVYLTDIWIQHKEQVVGEYNPTNRIDFVRAASFTKKNLLDLEDPSFIEAAGEMMKAPVAIRDLHIAEHASRSLTFVDRVITTRLPDEYEDFPTGGWTLHVTYGERHEALPLVFVKHQLSQFGYIKE